MVEHFSCIYAPLYLLQGGLFRYERWRSYKKKRCKMIKCSIFKTCLFVFSLSAQLSFAELRLSQESINVFRRSQAAALGMGSEFNARTTSLNCTLGLNYSKSRNRIEWRIVSSPRDESSSYDFETNYGFAFKASDCSKTTRKDTSGNSYLYTTCMKRKETCWSMFWN